MTEVTSTRSRPLSGKTALVTGGSRSIGASIAAGGIMDGHGIKARSIRAPLRHN